MEQQQTSKRAPRLNLPVSTIKDLAAEYRVTHQYVLQSLRFGAYSKMAKAIRQSAISHLEHVLAENKKLLVEYDQD